MKSNKIAFVRGEMINQGEYYDLKLFNAEGKKVYAATLTMIDAAEIMNKHNNIVIVKP